MKKGTLRIIKGDECKGLVKLRKELPHKSNYIVGRIYYRQDHLDLTFEYWERIQPIIICDDEIKANNKVLFKDLILTVNEFTHDDTVVFEESIAEHLKINEYNENAFREVARKILVLPNQFSIEFIQTIIDDKVKDGDEVELNDRHGSICEGIPYPCSCEKEIRPIKKSIEEVANILYPVDIKNNPYRAEENFYRREGFISGVKWQSENKLL